MDKEFTSHEEVDAYYSKQIDELPKGNVWSEMVELDLLLEWGRMKHSIERFGHAPPRNARIVNLSFSDLPVLMEGE
jgi:hypothetical protein